jgi:hypothetical protein
MREAIASSVRVDVRSTTVMPDDDEALVVERSAHANVLVEVGGDEAGGRRVLLRVHSTQGRRWIEKRIDFDVVDAVEERGRALGYALATMLPSTKSDESEEPKPLPGPAPAPAPAPLARSLTQERGGRESVLSGSNRPVAVGSPEVAFDLLASVASGFDGIANAGGAGAFYWFIGSHVSLRLGMSVRAGEISAASASTLTVSEGAGVAWHPWRVSRGQRAGLSLRLDYLTVERFMTRYSASPDDPQGKHTSPPVSAVDAFVDGTYRLAAGTQIVLGLGIENAFGETKIEIGNNPVTSLPTLCIAGEAGLRVEF